MMQVKCQNHTKYKKMGVITQTNIHKGLAWLARQTLAVCKFFLDDLLKQPTTAAVQKVTFHPITLLSKPAEKRLQLSVVW